MGCRKSRRFARQAPDWRGARTGSPRAQVRPGRRRHGEPPTRLPELAHPNCRPPELDSGRRRQLPSLIALDLTISGGSETYGEQMLTFIVSRESPQQFEYIKQAFSGEETVRVILDRRVGQRRRSPPSPEQALERRRSDRRSRQHLDRELQTLGWSLIR